MTNFINWASTNNYLDLKYAWHRIGLYIYIRVAQVLMWLLLIRLDCFFFRSLKNGFVCLRHPRCIYLQTGVNMLILKKLINCRTKWNWIFLLCQGLYLPVHLSLLLEKNSAIPIASSPRTVYKGLSYSGIYMNSCPVKMVGPTCCMALRKSFLQGRFPDQPGSGCCGGRCKKTSNTLISWMPYNIFQIM